MTKRRVVVTGLGVVSSIGIGKDEFWKNLIAGKSGISEVETFDTSAFDVHRGGEVKNFDPTKFIPKSRLKNIARASQFAIAATKMALEDARLPVQMHQKRKISVTVGTTMGEGGMIEEIDKHWANCGEEDVWATTIVRFPSNAISDNVSRYFKLSGMSAVVPTACSGGNYALGLAYDLVRKGVVDCALAGGADPFSRIGFTGFGRLFAMAPDMCRPFDRDRKGMMVGEGAGMLVLEPYDSAKKRNTSIYAEVVGYGLSCDAHHMTAPRLEGVTKVMYKGIKNAGINKKDVGYVSAHGTGTPANDKTECDAVKNIFKELTKDIPMSSIKSMLGHTMGAASAIEAVACCLVLANSILPPTINYQTPDPECDIDCVPNQSRSKDLCVVLNNSYAFGGNNACLVLKKYE